MQVTPMMQQYLDIKNQHQDCILFFRLGDFYEMFFEDAVTASRELDITLTGKHYGQEERAPMCGVPFHSADGYIAKLIERGYKVAICEQTEDPALAKGLVRREVVRIITPGTVLLQGMLQEKDNNYLMSLYSSEEGIGIACCDLSTGEILVTQLDGKDAISSMQNEIVKLSPREILIPTSASERGLTGPIKDSSDAYLTVLAEDRFQLEQSIDLIQKQYNTVSLVGLGIAELDRGIRALGALLSYFQETQKQNMSHLKPISVYQLGDHMTLDKATIKNLELTETLYDKKIQGSLLGVLDRTHTAMGSRKMKLWIREPLNRKEEIQRRQDAVEELMEQPLLRNHLVESLKGIYDLERLTGRIATGTANARDLIALRNSVSQLPQLKGDLEDCASAMLLDLQGEIDPLTMLHQEICNAIVEDPPFVLREGNLIRSGYSSELDEIKASIQDGQEWIAGLESKERESTGIRNLKVGFNKVFGYYLEITKSYYDLIPAHYIRKQTLANCERFITPELKEMESIVLNAETRINQLEYELFQQLRQKLLSYIPAIQKTSTAVACLDVLTAFAETSSKLGYVKPTINDSDVILIEKGRHPVIEHSIRNGMYVPNDAYLDRQNRSMLLITGPNMAGKSTYMRQVALVVLLAQIGCHVPAERAEIGVTDRIYTRIGASDNLSGGQSTFYVEMSELAYILNTATEKSLVILDEIGRGTSTYDGLSIAWAAVEYLCQNKNQIRTLFATHYHELTVLEGELKGVKNLNVDVQEQAGEIMFLHKIVPGSASRSYGIHVAQLAGIPSQLLEMAEVKLLELERQASKLAEEQDQEDQQQLSLFVLPKGNQDDKETTLPLEIAQMLERLRSIDPMNITGSESIRILEEMKHAAERNKA